MNVKKISLISLIALAVALCVFSINAAVKASVSPKTQLTVVLDAGHGGIDGGVTGISTKVKESDLNLEIVKELKAVLEQSGIRVVLTRSTKSGLYGSSGKGFKRRDMEKRKEIINSCSANAFVSIHLNFYSSPDRRGAQAFFKSGDENGEAFASIIQKHLNELSGQTRPLSPLKGDYYVLNESEPTATLVECGFLSNAEDEALLLTKEYRREIAEKIALGIKEMLFS